MFITYAEVLLTVPRLILLLIISDMAKALGYLIYPTVVIIGGPIKNSSGFCQISGFLLAVSVEASGTSYSLRLACCILQVDLRQVGCFRFILIQLILCFLDYS